MISNVTFEPSCRNNWHIHHVSSGGGQVLICVGGRGYYQEWGKEAVEMTILQVNFISDCLKRTIPMTVILPVDKLFGGAASSDEQKPFKS